MYTEGYPALEKAIEEAIEPLKSDYVDRSAVADEIIASFMNNGSSVYEVRGIETKDGNPVVFYFEEAYKEYLESCDTDF